MNRNFTRWLVIGLVYGLASGPTFAHTPLQRLIVAVVVGLPLEAVLRRLAVEMDR